MSSSQSATPPTIPGSLNVDTLQVNKVLKIVDLVVGDALSSLNSWKGAVDAATTANITLSGEQTVDGVALVAGDKVLVKDQATGSENGLYIVQELDWYRSDDMVDGSSAAGSAVFVKDGTANDDQIYVCTNAAGSDVVGTDGLDFASLTATIGAAGADTEVQYNSGGNLAADAGFTYDGAGAVTSTVSLNSAAVTASGTVTGGTLTDGALSSTAGTVTGGVAATFSGTVTGGTLSDGAGSTATGGVVTATTVSDGIGSTMSAGVVTGVTLTDGTATVTAGIVSGTNLTASGILTGTSKLDLGAGVNEVVGTALLGAGTVTVPNTSVTASSVIFVTQNTPGGVTGVHYTVPSGSITAGVSFVINATDTAGALVATDTSTVNYMIVN